MPKQISRFLLIAASSALVLTPVAAAAHGSSKSRSQATRTVSGANADTRSRQTPRALCPRGDALSRVLAIVTFGGASCGGVG